MDSDKLKINTYPNRVPHVLFPPIEDLWRIRHPHTKSFTFTSAAQRGAGTRIDRVYTSRTSRGKIQKRFMKTNVHSDHSSIHITFQLNDVELGKGSWTLNQTLISNPDYQHDITQFWQDWQRQKFLYPTLAEWWDAGKAIIKNISQNFSKIMAQGLHKQWLSLEKRLRNATRKADRGCPNAQLLHQQLSLQLKTLEQDRAKIHILRSKAQWVEEGEKCTKYFLNLGKKLNGLKKEKNAQNISSTSKKSSMG